MNELLTVELGSEMQLGEWLTYWFETYAKRTVKQSTAVSYIGYIKAIPSNSPVKTAKTSRIEN